MTSVTPGINSPELCQNICQVLTLTIDFLVSRIYAYRFFPFSSAARYAILLFFVDIRIETTLFSFLGCKAGETANSFYFQADPACVAITWTQASFPVFPLRFLMRIILASLKVKVFWSNFLGAEKAVVLSVFCISQKLES